MKDYTAINARWAKDKNIDSKNRKRGGRSHPWAKDENNSYQRYKSKSGDNHETKEEQS